MANQLKVAKVNSILTLHQQGWSNRWIARTLGVHRDTVNRHVRAAQTDPKPATAPPGSGGVDPPKPANAPLGSDAADPAKPANAPTGSSGAVSQCRPYRPIVLAKLAQGLSAQRIYQDLVSEHGYTGSYYSVRRFVRKLGTCRPLPFRRMECDPGQEAQVDLGRGAPVRRPNGRYRKPHVFRIALSYSRKAYSEAVWRQDTETFLRCLENAFWRWGGVPRTLVVDNLKAAVLQADWYDPELNPKLEAFCRHYGTAMLPTRPRMARHKGKVERQVDYVQENGLKGYRFEALAQENAYLDYWEEHVADTRIHGTTRRQVGTVFREEEQPALLPLPAGRFPSFQEGQRSVHRDGHVEVQKSYYSVPPEYLGRRVWVRWDGRTVRIFNDRLEQIAVHIQRQPGQFSTDAKHLADEKISAVERGTEYWLRKAGRIGPRAEDWARDMLDQRGIQGVRVLVGLLGLTRRHPERAIDQACGIASSHGQYRLRVIRKLIQQTGPAQEQFEFIDRHPIIRDLSDYSELVQTAIADSPTVDDTYTFSPRPQPRRPEESSDLSSPLHSYRSTDHEGGLTRDAEETEIVGTGLDAGRPAPGGGGPSARP